VSKPTGLKPSFGPLAQFKREPVTVNQAELVRQFYFCPNNQLPLVIEAMRAGVDLLAWVKNNGASLESTLLHHGAILFRGFNKLSAQEFGLFIQVVSGCLIEYRERSSPRKAVLGNIYTSTEYPAKYSIFPHNENSYAHTWPLKLFFYCENPPSEDGETPLVDVRKVYSRITPVTRERFERLGIMYVRNFSEALGLSWQATFQTDDVKEVERYCREAGYEIEWKEGSRLKTRRIGRAVVEHPKTGAKLWFNHAAFFHVSTLDHSIQSALLPQMSEESLPNNTYYGDGSSIEPSVLTELREAYLQEMISFRWKKGDLLMLDNMLTAHARSPYKGERRILVGMSEPFESRI
jgi:alpha-ketoglutarate-dependent taurine dioxygenase